MSDAIEDLYRLKRLRDQGGLSDEEYDLQKEAVLQRAARKGTAEPPEKEGGYPVGILAACAIVIAIVALFVVLRFGQAGVVQQRPPQRRSVPTVPTAKNGVPMGMSTWDGSQSMSAAGSQDMSIPAGGDAEPPMPQDRSDQPADASPPAAPANVQEPQAQPPIAIILQQQPPAPQDQQQASPPPELRLSASDISQAFQENPDRAESRLAGRRIVVVGSFDHATLDIPDYPSINLQGSDSAHDVGINLDRASGQKAAALTSGQRVTVVCDGISNMAGVPILDHCAL